MGNYESADAVYEELGGVLRDALADEAQLARLRQADAVFQFVLTEPEAVLTTHARAVLPVGVETGETKTVPDLVLAMTADAAKALLLHERSPVLMLTGGEVAMKGNATKLLQLLAALAPAPEADAAAEGPVAAESADADSVEETADAVSSIDSEDAESADADSVDSEAVDGS